MWSRGLGFMARAQLLLLRLDCPLSFRIHSGEMITVQPSVIIAGIGDSGTTAVTRALDRIGLEHCSARGKFEEPKWAHPNRSRHIRAFLNVSKGEFSREAFKRDAAEFAATRAWFQSVAATERACILRERKKKGLDTHGMTTEDVKWGFKEPHYAWLLPSLDDAFHNRTRYLLIARDPRDICTNDMQDQFHKYAPVLNISDCYEWWATFWSRLLEAYEHEPRFAIVRIEDLVLPDPSSSKESVNTMGCVVNHIGMVANWTNLQRAVSAVQMGMRVVGLAEDILHVGSDEADPQHIRQSAVEEAVANFHNHSGSYMGHHEGFGEEMRHTLVTRTANATNPPIIQQTMLRLGYDPMAFRLLKPTTRSCLCHSA